VFHSEELLAGLFRVVSLSCGDGFGQERAQLWAATGVVYSMRSKCGLELKYI